MELIGTVLYSKPETGTQVTEIIINDWLLVIVYFVFTVNSSLMSLSAMLIDPFHNLCTHAHNCFRLAKMIGIL